MLNKKRLVMSKIQYAFLEGNHVTLVMADNTTVPVPLFSTAQPLDYGPTGRKGDPAAEIVGITTESMSGTVNLKFTMSTGSPLYTDASPLITRGATGPMGAQTVAVGVAVNGQVQATYDTGLTTTIGQIQSATGPVGRGIQSLTLDDRGRLVVTLDNLSTIVAGQLMTPATTPPAGTRRVYIDPLTGQLYAVTNP